MADFAHKNYYNLADVIEIVRLLRDPETGCPWDREQTHESIRQNFLEETYEVLDAIDRGDTALLCEELGDVLLQVALHAEMERQAGGFSIDDVSNELSKKLILRHPHIFGDVAADTANEVLDNWEAIKRREKNQKSGLDAIRDVPRALPALMRAQKITKRAAYVGFGYENIEQALDDLQSEIAELRAAVAIGENVDGELGDVLFSAANVARYAGIDAEQCCESACARFIDRFAKVEALALDCGLDMAAIGADKLDELWQQAKQG